MQITVELAQGEKVEGVLVRHEDGKLELREPQLPRVPQYFIVPSVTVKENEIVFKNGKVTETVGLDQIEIPPKWPRDVETAAEAYINDAGRLVLIEPRCAACRGTGDSPLNPPGWFGGSCLVCDGTGNYQVEKPNEE